METAAAAAAATSEKSRDRKPCSVFDLPPNFFDSCRLLFGPSRSSPSLPAKPGDADNGDGREEKDAHHSNKSKETSFESAGPPPPSSSTSRWTCNTCKAEFDSLEEQRSHFKSDLHRLNVKLSISGRSIVKEDDFDSLGGSPLFEDFDISGSSGSEDEVDKDSLHRKSALVGGMAAEKQKLYISLPSGDTASLWRCLLLNETEDVAADGNVLNDTVNGQNYIEEAKLINKLKNLVNETRDKSHLRIVLLASGGHFAGSVFDGNSVIAHKTFHRYVVRAKAGKKQSTKDATGKAAHSAGSALRRYNEGALKKEIQELLISWKPFLDSSSCIFIHAPSTSRQMIFDGENPLLNSQSQIIRHVPLTVRRPTLEEAKRVYSLLTSMSYDIDKTVVLEETSSTAREESSIQQSADMESRIKSDVNPNSSGSCSIIDRLLTIDEAVSEPHGEEATPLHEAAKLGDAQRTLELLEQGYNPCIRDGRGRTPYMLATEKEVRNTFRRFMALNPDKWDWHAANVPSPLTKEMEEAQTAKQAEKDAKRKAKAKELKKLKKAKEKAKAQAALSENTVQVVAPTQGTSLASSSEHQLPRKGMASLSKEEEQGRALEAEREKRAAAAERRMAALNARLERTTVTPPSSSEPKSNLGDYACSCCNASLAGKVPFHRYDYKYCSTSCMFVHKEMLQDG